MEVLAGLLQKQERQQQSHPKTHSHFFNYAYALQAFLPLLGPREGTVWHP